MNGHPTREEDFELYALGALEGEEKWAIKSHITACADCARKMAEAQGRVALLAMAAPQVQPSAIVKQRLLAQIRTSESVEVPRSSSRKPGEQSQSFGRWWSPALVAVGVALALATIILWASNRRLDEQLATLRAIEGQQEHELQEAREMANLVSAQGSIIVPLAAQPGMPQGKAHVVYNAQMGMLMYDGEIESAPANRTYQLWLVPTKGSPISVGTFNSRPGQSNHFMMKLPQGIRPSAFAVTIEPAGGMSQPTGPKVLVGPVS